jgi:hypothetical protein
VIGQDRKCERKFENERRKENGNLKSNQKQRTTYYRVQYETFKKNREHFIVGYILNNSLY